MADDLKALTDEAAADLLEGVEADSKKLREYVHTSGFPKEMADARNVVNLLMVDRVLEHIDGALHLVKAGLVTPAHACARSAMESLWRWRDLLTDDMKAKRWLTGLEPGRHALSQACRDLRRLGRELDPRVLPLLDIDVSEFRSPSLYETATRVGLESMYLCCYPLLSAVAHPTVYGTHEGKRRAEFTLVLAMATRMTMSDAEVVYRIWRERGVVAPSTMPDRAAPER